jgi:hypothetical protein
MKIQNYKVIDLIESYNFDIKYIFYLTPHKKDIIFLIRQAIVRDHYATEFLYNYFEHLNVFKWKNSKLQSYRSRRDLQFHIKIIFIRRRYDFSKVKSCHATSSDTIEQYCHTNVTWFFTSETRPTWQIDKIIWSRQRHLCDKKRLDPQSFFKCGYY